MRWDGVRIARLFPPQNTCANSELRRLLPLDGPSGRPSAGRLYLYSTTPQHADQKRWSTRRPSVCSLEWVSNGCPRDKELRRGTQSHRVDRSWPTRSAGVDQSHQQKFEGSGPESPGRVLWLPNRL